MPESKPNIKSLRLYVRYMLRFPFRLSLGFAFSLTLALQATAVPLLVTLLLKYYENHHTINVGLLVFAGCLQLSLLLISFMSDRSGVAVLHDQVEERLYQDSFDYLVKQDYGFFADRFSGALVTQASRFAKSYTAFNDVIFFDVLPQIFGLVFSLVVIAFYSPGLSIAILVLWLFSMWAIVKFAMNRLPLRRGAVAKESEQIGELADAITNAITIKTFSGEDREKNRYSAVNKWRGRLFLNSWHRAVRNAWIVQGICVFLQMSVLTSGLLLLKSGSITLPTFLLFQVYIFRIVRDIGDSVFMVRQFEVVSGDAQEMTELLEQPPLIQDKLSPEKSRIQNGSIVFKNVGFQYEDDTRPKEHLFEKFNLSIPAGEKIGLVGPSGGGKTTITRLMLRFMDVQDGSVEIDGHDIRNIKQQDLRRAIAYVPQDPLLFHRSIKENISYARPSASDSEIIDVAKKAFAHDFIKDLPDGYDTLVGERGVKLSGGQRQRVAIARAMLADAPILILDEATSALDSQSERYIQKALLDLMKGKTAVVIAHRLSTIQRMDRIVVLDEGKIIEEGSHKQLLDQNGLYAKLWAHQSGGFLEG